MRFEPIVGKIKMTDAKEQNEVNHSIRPQEGATCEGYSRNGKKQDNQQDKEYQQIIRQEKHTHEQVDNRCKEQIEYERQKNQQLTALEEKEESYPDVANKVTFSQSVPEFTFES